MKLNLTLFLSKKKTSTEIKFYTVGVLCIQYECNKIARNKAHYTLSLLKYKVKAESKYTKTH